MASGRPIKMPQAALVAAIGIAVLSAIVAGVTARDMLGQSGIRLAPAEPRTLRLALPEPTHELPGNVSATGAFASKDAGSDGPVPEIAVAQEIRSMDAKSGGSALEGLVPVRYNLASAHDLASPASPPAVSSVKVRVRNKKVGTIDLLVTDAATLSVDGAAVAKLVSGDQELAKRLGDTSTRKLTLSQLRDLGLSVRYDPVADTIDLDLAG